MWLSILSLQMMGAGWLWLMLPLKALSSGWSGEPLARWQTDLPGPILAGVGYIVDNVYPLYRVKKRMVFLAFQAVARMVIWETRKNVLYDGANSPTFNLILFFRHQLRVKIKCDWKSLGCITFDRRWVHVASLVVRKRATLESSFIPIPVHGDDGSTGSFWTSPQVSR